MRQIYGGVDDRLLVSEVMIEGGRPDTDLLGDDLHVRVRDAVLVEELDRDTENLLSPVGMSPVGARSMMPSLSS